MRWPIRIGARNELIEGRVLNASSTGILFSSQALFRVGDTAEVDVVVSALAFFRCTLLIVREHGGSWLERSYGARFLHLNAVDRQILLKGLEAASPSQRPGVQSAPAPFA